MVDTIAPLVLALGPRSRHPAAGPRPAARARHSAGSTAAKP